MTYQQLLSKYKTDEMMDVLCRIVNVDGQPEYVSKYPKYVAPLGDFIGDFISHRSVPWWRRSAEWRKVDRKLRDVLNTIHVAYAIPEVRR